MNQNADYASCRHCGEKITRSERDPKGPWWVSDSGPVCPSHVGPFDGRLGHEPADYVSILRERAQSILEAVQRLEDLHATADDNDYANVEFRLNEADTDAWALVNWIEDGSKERAQ